MVNGQLTSVVRHLHRLARSLGHEDLSDGQLLDRFFRGDQAAFAALVGRHGPLVLGVCRRLLGQAAAAEDAFQATFLVLFRRARFLDGTGSLANWLYTVAYRVALKAKADAARRQRCEQEVRNMPRKQAHAEDLWSDLQPLLDEELNRLPEHYRAAVVVCYLEGRTNSEAARLLGCPAGTVKSRLARARDLLRARLVRRGVTLSSAMLAALVAERASAAVSPSLTQAAVRTTVLAATGKALAPAAILAEGVVQTLFVSRFKVATLLLLALGTLLFAAGAWTYQAPARGPAEQLPRGEQPPAAQAQPKPPPAGPATKTDDKAMTMTGRVLDTDGRPLAGAQVAVLAGVRRFQRHGSLSADRTTLGAGKTDDDGRFSLSVPRTSSAANWGVDLLAAHPGYGLAWQSFDPDAERPEVTVRLGPEQVIRGQLLDIQGQPAAGVKLHLARLARVPPEKNAEARLQAEKERAGGNALQMNKDVSLHNDDLFLHDASDAPSLWPGAVTTDDQGRFTIRGIGRGMSATLYVADDRFAFQSLTLPDTSKSDKAENFTQSLEPAHVLEGRVTYADSGKPAANVQLMAWGWGSRTVTDRQGRFHLISARGPFYSGEEVSILMAFPAEGDPYCNTQKEFRWPRGVVRHTLDLALPRGILVRGKVTDETTGKPVAGAQVRYFAQQNNPNLKPEETGPYNFANGRDMLATGEDGTFRMACRPGPGYLLIEGPDADYILHENGGQQRLFTGRRGGQPWRSHGFVALDLTLDAEPAEAVVALRKGVTLRGEVVGPDGEAVNDVQVFCQREGFNTHPVKVRGQRFELHGCAPDDEIAVLCFDAAHSWGAAAKLSAKEAADKPASVRLTPCGSAQVRFLDKESKPLADFIPGLFLVLAPKQGDLAAQTLQIASPFRKSAPHTDADGFCTFSTLIPGATYQFGHAEIRTTFTAEPGKTVKVPDVVVRQNP